jgi:hypothetical protein
LKCGAAQLIDEASRRALIEAIQYDGRSRWVTDPGCGELGAEGDDKQDGQVCDAVRQEIEHFT